MIYLKNSGRHQRILVFISVCLVTLSGCDKAFSKNALSDTSYLNQIDDSNLEEQIVSNYQTYIKYYPGYTWGEEQWITDFATGGLNLTISFETFGGNTIDSLCVLKGQNVNIDFGASRIHSTFLGWYYDANGDTEIDYYFIASESVTLFAKYNSDETTIGFLVDDNVYRYETCNYGDIIELPESPNKLGYRFIGWETDDGVIWDKNNRVLEDDLSLRAVFDYDFLEIPAVIINTDDGKEVTSKDEYKQSNVSILNTKKEWIIDCQPAGIRGRGNSSWQMDKKPYRIKFNKKQSLFGYSYKAKSWTLIPNHSDKSLLRNYIAYEISDRFVGIDFSSKHILVDLYFNEEYQGVYLLCDQVQVGEGRVNIDDSVSEDGNNGYLIERDSRIKSEGIVDTDYFYFQEEPYAIKSPDTDKEDYLTNKETEIAFIRDYMQLCFDAIESGQWSDVKDLIDINSFADSYIIDELFANTDCGYSSCFYYKDKNGKLFKGPIWDFDIGAGNVNYNMGNTEKCEPDIELYAATANTWYSKLLSRSEFRTIVSKRIVAYNNIVFDIINLLYTNNDRSIYALNGRALERNFEKWDIMGMYIWPEPESVFSIETLTGQIEYLRQWLSRRCVFLMESY